MTTHVGLVMTTLTVVVLDFLIVGAVLVGAVIWRDRKGKRP